jgi:DNA-directed RNA polymerase specialized sigma24 family protein
MLWLKCTMQLPERRDLGGRPDVNDHPIDPIVPADSNGIASVYESDTETSLNIAPVPPPELGAVALAGQNAAPDFSQALFLTTDNFTGFYKHWYPEVIIMVRQQLARDLHHQLGHEDITQSVFEGLTKNYLNKDVPLGGESYGPEPLLRVLVRNKAIDHWARFMGVSRLPGETYRHFLPTAPQDFLHRFDHERPLSPEEIYLENTYPRESAAGHLHALLAGAELTAVETDILFMADAYNVNSKEIAAKYGVSHSAMRTRLTRLRQRLRAYAEEVDFWHEREDRDHDALDQ